MNGRRIVLKNGIALIHSPVPTLESATFTVWYKVGSRYEDKKVAGISHFLEHMAFKGSKKYPTAKDVSEAMDALGAEDNAATSQEYTNYYVRSAVDSLEKAVDILADALLNPLLEEKEIKRERGVIIEEINMYKDDPKSYVHELYDSVVFPKHPLGRDIAGTKETVQGMKKEDFLEFRKKHYHPENIVITVAGGIAFEVAKELAEKYFGNLRKTGDQSMYKEFKEDQKKPNLILKSRKTEQTNLIIGFPGFRHGLENRYAEGLMGIILGSGMSSRLFREVREKRGLAYTVYASSSHYLDTGEFSAYAGVPVKKATEAIKVILEEFYKIGSGKHGISAKELTKAKAYLKGHTALSMESTKAISYFYGHEEIKGGKLRSLEEVFEKVDSVKIDEVVEVAKQIFNPKKVNLAVIGPYKSQTEFEKVIN